MLSNSYIPVISKPTRVTETSATLIDHIWVNNLELSEQPKFKSGIVVDDISDHLPVFLIRNVSKYPQGYSKIKFRVFSDENISNFKEEIACRSSELCVIVCDPLLNINEKTSRYIAEYKKSYDKHFPLKMKKKS